MSATWFRRSSRSSGGNSRNTCPKRFAFSSRNWSRYNAAAIKARASIASPRMLTVMCRTDQALRPAAAAPGASPIKTARLTNPVASGPVKTPTAPARYTRSLTTWSSIRKSASIESAGATPISVSCATPTTWHAIPRRGAASVRPGGGGRSPAYGASASAVATPYSPSARRWARRTTRVKRRPLEWGRRESRGHLPDETRRHPRNDIRVVDVQHEPRRRMLAGVHDLENDPHLLGARDRRRGRWPVHLEHVAGHDPVGTATVDEDDLLRRGEDVAVPLSDHEALESLHHRSGAHSTWIRERLERKRQVSVLDARELHDQLIQNLLALHLRDPGDAQRHHHPAPASDVAVDAHDQERIPHMVRRAPWRRDRDLVERDRGR